MNIDILKQNYYQLFKLPQQFSIDELHLKSNMRDLQQRYHPDNFASHPEEQVQALALSSHINSAYQTLLEPLSRASYLLQLNGIVVDLVHDTKFPADFLMTQIELREEITTAEVAADFDALSAIEESLKQNINKLVAKIESDFTDGNYTAIIEAIKKLAFFVKLAQLVDNILATL